MDKEKIDEIVNEVVDRASKSIEKTDINVRILRQVDALANRAFTGIKESLDKKINDKTSDLRGVIESELDGIKKSIKKELSGYKKVEIKTPKGTVKVDGLVHEEFGKVLTYIACRVPILLVGNAGTGKTTLAEQVAEALGLTHYSISVNEQTSKSDFLGFVDAVGNIHKTNFRKAYEQGGVFIIDEIDAGNANILTVINSALANGFCSFPDGMVKRHEDFVCVCTANTFGDGESIQFIGRNVLDSATKDRFASFNIGYSKKIESALVPEVLPLMENLRKHYNKNNILHVISTRGGIRLKAVIEMNKGKVTKDLVVECFNLHQIIDQDLTTNSAVNDFVKEYNAKQKKDKDIEDTDTE